jgi:hypothetical protein
MTGAWPQIRLSGRVCVFALLALSAAIPAQAQTTALFLDSQPDHYVGRGLRQTFTSAQATFFVEQGFGGIRVFLSSNPNQNNFAWSMTFRAPDSAPLQVGSYTDAVRLFASPTAAWIDLSGDGRGCNLETGRFRVREIELSGAVVQRLAIDFEHHCEDTSPAVYGALRYNSTVSSLVPFDGDYPRYGLTIAPTVNGTVTGSGIECDGAGPACALTLPSPATLSLVATPDPGYLFAGWNGSCHGVRAITIQVNSVETCAALFVPVGELPADFASFNSQPGDPAGRGLTELFNGENSGWTVTPQIVNGLLNSVALTIIGRGDHAEQFWTARFGATQGGELVPGVYAGAVRTSTTTQPSMEVRATSTTCNSVDGAFTVHELTMDAGVVTALAVDFDQQCGASTIPPRRMRGSIRYHSNVPIAFTLTASVTGGGSVMLEPGNIACATTCFADFALGTTVQITPVAASGYVFTSWTGDPDCTDGVIVLTAPAACGVVFTPVVTAGPLFPSSGSGVTQTFTAEFASGAGADDIRTAWMWINPSFAASAANSCLFYYDNQSHLFWLLNDAGTSWTPSTVTVSGGTLQNSRCRVTLSSGNVVFDGTVLRIRPSVTFKAAHAGQQHLHLYAESVTGATSGWQERGQWTVPVAAVTANSVTPSSGVGANQLFTLTYSGTYAAADIATAWVWFNETFASSAAHSCLLYYERAGNRLFLLDDAGQQWQSAFMGGNVTLQNSQCAVTTTGSSTQVTEPQLRVNLAITFKPVFAGAKHVFLYADGGAPSGWQDLGTWTAQALSVTTQVPTPASGAGSSQSFVLPYSSSLGATALATTWVWFNGSFSSSSAGSCLAYYERATNRLFLLNDAATVWQSAILGTPATLENGQCTIDVGASSVALAGDTLTLQLALTFKPAFAGAKNIYMYASSLVGVASGWSDRGDWAVPGAPGAPTADAVTPDSGSGNTRVFALAYSSESGTAALTSTWVWFNETLASSAAASCLAYYEPSSDRLYLLDDAGTLWLNAVMGTATTLDNSQCTIDVAASSAASNGNTLTLSLAMTFRPGFAGLKNIYAYAASGDGTSGWQDRGDWEVPPAIGADSVMPGNGTGSAQTFAFAYSSVSGATDLTTAWVWVNATFAETAATSCLVYYDRGTGTLHLLDDAGTTWQSAGLGTSTPLQNGQCTIDVSTSAVTAVGNTLTLSLPITFAPAFAGAKNIYMYAATATGNSGWHDRGDWVVP